MSGRGGGHHGRRHGGHGIGAGGAVTALLSGLMRLGGLALLVDAASNIFASR